MKIAITVGSLVVKACADAGHYTYQINRTEQEYDGTKNSEMRTADSASDYKATLEAFKGADAVIHLAAIPNPEGQDDYIVHNNNVNSAFIALRAAGELGIKKFCLASSVNAIGLAYANQPLKFDYFPMDEKVSYRPTDSYALAKQEAETQAQSFVHWFPGMNVASMRIHEVAPLKDVQKEHEENAQSGIKQLWGWVNPKATARACLLSVEKDLKGRHEIFNIVAPNTTQSTPSRELAKQYYPDVEIKPGFDGSKGFWDVSKAKELLGWEHTETE
ncbi:MAG: hypothetical protein CYPHOPRED_005933 [Cyphobasidiales sp. Tagirdzhanova-0007]|nr:MAG: hypothetical protein CYPHOPRED_005933 [Cyphobasidiales sp. Tagirdzhanova-0007]